MYVDKILELVTQIISPGKTWGNFFRKTLSTLLVASIGAYAFNAYRTMGESHWEKLPLHSAIKKNAVKKEVEQYLQLLINSDPSLLSVWLYSWPDARSLIPVHHAGNHDNPIPLGYFWKTDRSVVGSLVMAECDCLERPGKKFLVCPIMAENDAWGIILFEHKNTVPKEYKIVYMTLAHKLADLIYNPET